MKDRKVAMAIAGDFDQADTHHPVGWVKVVEEFSRSVQSSLVRDDLASLRCTHRYSLKRSFDAIVS